MEDPSFPMLVRRLVVEHHPVRGLAEMQDRTGIPYMTLWRWERGHVTQLPERPLIERLAKGYGLQADDVLGLAYRDWLRRQKGEPVAVPQIQARKRGPNPSPDSIRSRRRRRGAAVLLAALSLVASSAWASPGPQPVTPIGSDTVHSVNLRRDRRYRNFFSAQPLVAA